MTNKLNRITSGDWVLPVMVWLMRIVVGGVFVFSGLAKAIDPWGSFYKFNEYLLTLGWDSMLGLSLFAAFAVPIIETVLGLMLLVGAYRRGAPLLLLLMMLVMLPLTLWLAVTNAVPDCGCFGDALILSNWGTFGKNVALTLGLIFLLIFNKRVKGLYGPAVQWIAAALTMAVTLGICLYGYFTQPLIDFRPYRVGTQLVSAQSTGNDDQDFVFIYSKDGVEQEFMIDSLPDEEEGWTYVDRRPLPVQPDTVATDRPKHHLAVMDDAGDVSDEVLSSGRRQLLLLFPDIQDVNIAHTFAINELVDYARTQGAAVYGITSASERQREQWSDISMAEYPLLVADDSDIKMMARGNPAVMSINDGVVEWKRTLGSIDLDRLRDPSVTMASLSNDFQPWSILRRLLGAFAMLMLALLVFNRTHLLLQYLYARLRRSTENSDTSENSDYSDSSEKLQSQTDVDQLEEND